MQMAMVLQELQPELVLTGSPSQSRCCQMTQVSL